MNRRNFLQYAAIAPVSISTLAFTKAESIEPNPHNILNNFHYGNIDKIIMSVEKYGPNIITSIGHLSLSSFDIAFKMIEHSQNLPKLIVTSPHQCRNISMYCYQCINNNKLWDVEMLAINHPSLQNKILILPDSNNVNNASMIEIYNYGL